MPSSAGSITDHEVLSDLSDNIRSSEAIVGAQGVMHNENNFHWKECTLIVGQKEWYTFTPDALSIFPLILNAFYRFMEFNEEPDCSWLSFVTNEKEPELRIHVKRSAKAFEAINRYGQGVPLQHIIHESDPEAASLIWTECMHYHTYKMAQGIFVLSRLAWKDSIIPDTLFFQSNALKDAPSPFRSCFRPHDYFPVLLIYTSSPPKDAHNGVTLERHVNYSGRYWLTADNVVDWTNGRPTRLQDPYFSGGYPVQLIMSNTVFASKSTPDLLDFVKSATYRLDAQLLLFCLTDGTTTPMGGTICIGSTDGGLNFESRDVSRRIHSVTYKKTCDFAIPLNSDNSNSSDRLDCCLTVSLSLQIPEAEPFQKLLKSERGSEVFSDDEKARGRKAARQLILHVTETTCSIHSGWMNGTRVEPSAEVFRTFANNAEWSRQIIGRHGT